MGKVRFIGGPWEVPGTETEVPDIDSVDLPYLTAAELDLAISKEDGGWALALYVPTPAEPRGGYMFPSREIMEKFGASLDAKNAEKIVFGA